MKRCRSQSLHGTAAAKQRSNKAARSAESKAAPRDGRQEGGCVSSTERQNESKAPTVPARAKQGADNHAQNGSWVEASVWKERMLAALGNGVKGDKGYLLRWTGGVHRSHCPWTGEPIPMRKPPTGEPCAGEPHARFGGRGGPTPFPTPIGRVRTFRSDRRIRWRSSDANAP